MICKFDEKKRSMVKSLGFYGLLHFPSIKQMNRKFAIWIMNCFEPSSNELVVSDYIRIKVSKHDVGMVLGISCCGKSVFHSSRSPYVAKDKVVRDFLGSEFKQHRSIKAV